MKKMGKFHYIIPVFVPDLGCPHQCVFCNQKRITGLDDVPDREKVAALVEDYLKTMPGGPGIKREVAYYGGSFTAIEPALQRELLAPAYRLLIQGKIDGIRVSTRPDSVSEDIMALLSSYGVNTVELGVQSMDDTVLFKSGRGHSSRDVLRASAFVKAWGMNLGFQMMIGLPGDSEKADLYTASELIALKPDLVRIYPCLVLKGTRLAEMFEHGEYNPLTIDRAVKICRKLLLMFERAEVNIVRIGLQPSEQINLEGDVLAGPYHPAFRELVESAVARDQVEYLLKKAAVEKAVEIEITVPEQDVSFVRGHKGGNVEYFKQKYGIIRYATVINFNLQRGIVKLTGVDGRKVDYTVSRKELPIVDKILER